MTKTFGVARAMYREVMRDEILTQAVLQVDEIGKVTMRGVGDRVGVAPGGLYHHFKNIEDLERAVRLFFWADVLERAQEDDKEIPAHPGDIAAFVEAVIKPYQAEYPRRFNFLCGGGVASPMIQLVFDMGAVSDGK